MGLIRVGRWAIDPAKIRRIEDHSGDSDRNQGDMASMLRMASRIAAGRMVVMSLQGPNQFFINYEDDPKNYRVGYGWGTTWKMEESVERHHAVRPGRKDELGRKQP